MVTAVMGVKATVVMMEVVEENRAALGRHLGDGPVPVARVAVATAAVMMVVASGVMSRVEAVTVVMTTVTTLVTAMATVLAAAMKAVATAVGLKAAVVMVEVVVGNRAALGRHFGGVPVPVPKVGAVTAMVAESASAKA